jgi:hypothetical protein
LVTVTDGVALPGVALSGVSVRVTATVWLPVAVEVEVVTGTTTGFRAPGATVVVAEVQTSFLPAVLTVQVHPVSDVGSAKVSCVGAVAVKVTAWWVDAPVTEGSMVTE